MVVDTCQVTIIDEQRIARAKAQMPAETVLTEMAETFKLLGDPTRVRILQALATTELCVCDLAALLEMTSSAISHQLRLLRARSVVRFRKEGKIVYYRLDDSHVQTLVEVSLRHAADAVVFHPCRRPGSRQRPEPGRVEHRLGAGAGPDAARAPREFLR